MTQFKTKCQMLFCSSAASRANPSIEDSSNRLLGPTLIRKQLFLQQKIIVFLNSPKMLNWASSALKTVNWGFSAAPD